jgi:hypothetical protein
MGLISVSVFIRKGTVYIWSYVYNSSGTLTDPTGSIKVTVSRQSDSTKVVDAQAMTKSATGTYYYIYRTDTSVELGKYNIEVHSVDGSGDTAVTSTGTGNFTLKQGITE